MRGLHKSKRISWAPDVNLCQVRLFLSEESPSQVGLGAQDHLQAKTSWVPHSAGTGADDVLPPGFEGSQSAYQLQIKLAEIPVIKWICPPRYVLDLNWQVVAGEESVELEVQNQREMRVLEAVYPRPSAIPPDPSVSVEIEKSLHNDQQTPLIPITPIEDEDAAIETMSNFLAPLSAPVSSQPQLLASGTLPSVHCSMPSISNAVANGRPAVGMGLNAEPSIVTAAFTAMTRSNEHANIIDQDLLINILSNPKLVENLIAEYGTASSAQNLPKTASAGVPPSELPLPVPLSEPAPVHINRTENGKPPSAATSSGSFYTHPNGVGIGPSPNIRTPAVPGSLAVSNPPAVGLTQTKDINYYKNLIQQHGGDRQEPVQQFSNRYSYQLGPNQESLNNPKTRDLKPKIMKPCIYFNSSRGCRHGANCAYQHDASSQQRGNSIPEVPNAKRMKMDREISS